MQDCLKTVKVIMLLCLSLLFVGGACPSTKDSLLDEVKDALDRGDFATAATKADQLVTEEDTPENRILAGNAYFGKAGVDLLSLIGEFASLIDNVSVSDLAQMACVVHFDDPTGSLADVHAAIERLGAIDSATLADKENKEAAFQLVMMQALEALILPTNRGASLPKEISSCASATFTVTTATLDAISDDDVANVLNDYISADNHLRNAGFKNDDEILKALFDNYCRLKGASAGNGFTRGELQAFVWCELDSGSFPADGFGGVANCTAFAESTALNAEGTTRIRACNGASDLREGKD